MDLSRRLTLRRAALVAVFWVPPVVPVRGGDMGGARR